MDKLSAKEKYELKKSEKLERKKEKDGTEKTNGHGKKFLWAFILVALVILLYLGLKSIVKNNTPQGNDFSRSVPSAGRGHISVGAVLPEGTYSSNPPSSGPHYPSTARGGFYDIGEIVEDQFVVHNLEHGDIWIAYHPGISKEVKNILENFGGRYVLVSPREKNESDIFLVAWQRIDGFSQEELTKERVKDFILRYDNKGPEQVRGGGGHQAGIDN